jgi:hypothetical protein
MKKNFTLSIAVLLFLTLASVAAKAEIIFPGGNPTASFSKMWVDYDVWDNGVKGMRLHFKFTVYSMKGIDGDVAIFFKDEAGNRLKDKNKNYYSSGGDVALYIDIKPGYDAADYDDLQVFMPYNELDIDAAGKYNLTMETKLIYASGTTIQNLTNYSFEYTKGATPVSTTPATTADAIFDKMWIDYDVTENGQKGMRIHVKCSVINMKNVDAYLAISFQKENGDILTTTNSAFSSKSGQVALYVYLTPGYDNTSYEDLSVFMPYSELNLTPGKYDLTMDADIQYKNGDLVKHLNYYDFWYEKK